MTGLTRTTTITVLGICLLAIMVIAVWFGARQNDTDMKNEKVLATAAIPSIDLTTPARTETATFALG